MRPSPIALVLLLIAVPALAGCGDGNAQAAPSGLEGDSARARTAGMRTMGAALERLEAWAEGDWSRAPAPEAAQLGGDRPSVPADVEGLVSLLHRALQDVDPAAAGAAPVPHAEQRLEDARLAVRLLAAHVAGQDRPRATRALARVRAACVHCHERCGR